MTEQTFRRDQTVWVIDYATGGPSPKHPGAWTVQRVNQRSLTLTQADPATGRVAKQLRCDKSLVTDTEPAGRPAAAETIGMPYRMPWTQGQVVRWAGPTCPAKAGTRLFVVITDDGGPEVGRLVPLGNVCGRYWRRVAVRLLTPVSLDDILQPGAQD